MQAQNKIKVWVRVKVSRSGRSRVGGVRVWINVRVKLTFTVKILTSLVIILCVSLRCVTRSTRARWQSVVGVGGSTPLLVTPLHIHNSNPHPSL